MTDYRCRRCKEDVHRDATQCPHCSFNPSTSHAAGVVKGVASVALQGATGGLAGRNLGENAKNDMEDAAEGVAERKPDR